MKSVLSCLALGLLVGLLPLMAPDATQAASRRGRRESYERWIAPPALRPAERRALRLVRSWGRRHGLRLLEDTRLALAARASLPLVPREPGMRLDLEAARREAQRAGLTDGELAAVAVVAPRGVDFGESLLGKLEAEVTRLGVNRVGLAVAADSETTAVLVLFSRRLVKLWPIAAEVERDTSLRVGGSLPGGTAGVMGLSLVAAMPDGEIRKLKVDLVDRHFDKTIAVGTVVGVLQVQLLLDRGRGPEIAAQFPVGVGTPPLEERLASPAGAEPTADTGAELSEGELAARLSDVVLGAREASGLALPAASAILCEVAQAHAADMRDRDYFAHRSDLHGDLSLRLKKSGVRFSRALENLAAAASIDDVLGQWLASPAHRANLFDADIDTFGVGVALLPAIPADGKSGRIYAVLVLARLADEGDAGELAARALVRINTERVRRGLPALSADPELGRLAVEYSAQGASGHDPRAIDSTKGALVKRVFAELDVAEAAADVFVTNSLAVVTRSKHLGAAFDRAGVGVFAPGATDGRMWVTVIYAAD